MINKNKRKNPQIAKLVAKSPVMLPIMPIISVPYSFFTYSITQLLNLVINYALRPYISAYKMAFVKIFGEPRVS